MPEVFPPERPSIVLSSTPAPEQPSGFTSAHAVGGVGSLAVGAIAVAVANHFGYQLSDSDSLLVGGAVVGAGVGLGHVVSRVGLFGLFHRLLHGSE